MQTKNGDMIDTRELPDSLWEYIKMMIVAQGYGELTIKINGYKIVRIEPRFGRTPIMGQDKATITEQ